MWPMMGMGRVNIIAYHRPTITIRLRDLFHSVREPEVPFCGVPFEVFIRDYIELVALQVLL